MSNQAKKDRDAPTDVPTGKKLDQLYSLIDGIDVAMMTTRSPDGALVSRPMSTQTRDAGTDLWFMTNIESGKCNEIKADAHVNLGYYKDGSREWVSVSGLARVTQNRAKIHDLYARDWKMWLGDEGGARDGGPDDPRIALIEVEAQSATYLKQDRPGIVALFSIAKGLITGAQPKVGVMGELGKTELEQGAGRDK